MSRIVHGYAGVRVARSNKYRAKATEVDGILFHSTKESKRYLQLKLLESAKRISELQLQVPYELTVNGMKVCKYIVDFRYRDTNGEWVNEDVKGFRTDTYIIKKKLMKACYGIDVVEA